MIINANTDYPTEIRKGDGSHKYGNDAMAEYLDHQNAGMDGDRFTGDSDWGVYLTQFGKRLLFGDCQGFVWVDKYESVAAADAVFEAVERDYLDWCSEGEE